MAYLAYTSRKNVWGIESWDLGNDIALCCDHSADNFDDAWFVAERPFAVVSSYEEWHDKVKVVEVDRRVLAALVVTVAERTDVTL